MRTVEYSHIKGSLRPKQQLVKLQRWGWMCFRCITSSAAMGWWKLLLLLSSSSLLRSASFYPHSVWNASRPNQSVSQSTFHKSKCSARHFKNQLREQRRLRRIWNLFTHKSPWVGAGGRCVSWLGAPSCSSQWSTPLGCRKLHSSPDYMHQHEHPFMCSSPIHVIIYSVLF